jgi:putative spermidine/putrescine transport system substrate-binding protein
MLNRRTFLLTSLAATVTTLSGCSSSENALNVTLLQDSIPLQLISDFQKLIAKTGEIKLKPEVDLQAILKLLQTWQKPEEKTSALNSLPVVGKQSIQQANLVTLGDYWLQNAIANNLIEPLDTTKLKAWSSLPPLWQNLVRRDRQGNVNPQGEVYGAPYRWGNTVMAYRKDKITWTPTDWSNLWREELRGRISLLDDYREIIGLTLKKLGHSYNTTNLSQIPNLETELQQLQQQVKFYSSDKYLQPLVLGDTWLAVGWSTDILAAMKRNSNIAIAVPNSGTALWADLWVQPRLTSNSKSKSPEQITSLSNNWIDFCWQSKSVKQILLFTNGISPIFNKSKEQVKPNSAQDTAKNSFVESSIATFDKSEFLYPLSPETETEYLNLWQKIRQT